MSLTARSALSTLEDNSAALVPALHARLAALCDAPPDHARFLNTLSLMEHIGSRKIMTTQSAPAHDTLKHLAEETRHAFFFKRAAERMAGGPLDYDDAQMLAGPAARAYMDRLDAHIDAALPPARTPAAAYLYMSLIVELRAVWFYRLYQDVLASRAMRLNLKSVLAEEELHLDDMLTRLAPLDAGWERRTQDFAAYEGERFRVLWAALDAAYAA